MVTILQLLRKREVVSEIACVGGSCLPADAPKALDEECILDFDGCT